MDKLEAVRLAARELDSCGDEELNARTDQEKSRARQRMIEAERAYARALDALHEARTPGTDHDAAPKPSMERTG